MIKTSKLIPDEFSLFKVKLTNPNPKHTEANLLILPLQFINIPRALNHLIKHHFGSPFLFRTIRPIPK